MHAAGIALLVVSIVVVLAVGIMARWRYDGGGGIGSGAVRVTALGLAGVAGGIVLLALASR